MILVDSISKSFDTKDVLKDISLNLERGKVNMIIGRNKFKNFIEPIKIVKGLSICEILEMVN